MNNVKKTKNKTHNNTKNQLKNIDKDLYIPVEQKQTIRKSGIYFGYTSRIAILLIFLIILAISSYMFITKSINIQSQETIKYTEKSNIDYKVKLKDNNYFESTYLKEDMSYISTLIDRINLNFQYQLDTDKYLEGSYEYAVKGTLEIRNTDTGDLFFTKKYNLVGPTKKIINEDNTNININQEVVIDYNYYNTIASGFKSTYGLNTKSNLIVTLEVSKIIPYSNKLSKTENYDITIPLSERSISIKLDRKKTNITDTIILKEEDYKYNTTYLVIGIISILLLIICICIFINKIKILFMRKNKYDKKLSKILKEYDRLIVNAKNIPQFKENEVIEVSNFEELLDAKENLHKPIYYYNISRHNKCIFYVRGENEVIVFTLKAVDL